MNIITRLFQPPKDSFFLFGPRGTGKTTWLRSLYPDALWLDLLQPEILRRFLSQPETLAYFVHGQEAGTSIVMDEIQKAPALLSVVHQLIEEKKGYQFILTGSSARKLKRATADLLGGRAVMRMLHPFMASELGEQFSLPSALAYGLLPLIQGKEKPQDTLEAYISLYLHEEIQAEGLIRSLEHFSRFLEAIAFSHASLLNITNVARECQVKRKTVENYISILEELLLARRLSVFSKRAQRELSTHPKFYLFDAGIFSLLRPRGYLDSLEEVNGAALEGLVAQHLFAWQEYSSNPYTIHFWRTRFGLEVDFIVYGENGLWAIEVKNSKSVYPEDIRSLTHFLEDYPMAQAILLYRGLECMRIGKVWCVPCEDFLKQLTPNRPPYKGV